MKSEQFIVQFKSVVGPTWLRSMDCPDIYDSHQEAERAIEKTKNGFQYRIVALEQALKE